MKKTIAFLLSPWTARRQLAGRPAGEYPYYRLHGVPANSYRAIRVLQAPIWFRKTRPIRPASTPCPDGTIRLFGSQTVNIYAITYVHRRCSSVGPEHVAYV